MRHVDTHTLWVQEKVRSKQIELCKIHGESNPADLLTKHLLSQDELGQLAVFFGCAFRSGIAVSPPLLRKRVDDPGDEALKDECKVDIIEGSDNNGVIFVHEAVMHDMSIWPRMHSKEAVDRLFPLVLATDELEDTSE